MIPSFLTHANQQTAHDPCTLDNSLERLFEFLKVQSISTDPAFKEQCRAGADFMARELSGLGLDTSVRPTAGHPVVVGKSSTGEGGCNNVHSPLYDFSDEILTTGAAYWVNLVQVELGDATA